jgi:hypothetical protein
MFVISDRHKVVVSDRALPVAGGRVRRHGPVHEVQARGDDTIGLHGSSFASHLGALLTAGIVCAIAASVGAEPVARIAVLVLIVAVVRAAVVLRRTDRTARLLRDGSAGLVVISAPEDRDDLEVTLKYVGQIWEHRRRIDGLPDPSPLLTQAVREVGLALRRRQDLRIIRADIAGLIRDGLTVGSAALEADRLQSSRADMLWKEAHRDVAGHLAGLYETVEAGAALVREIELGDAARRTRNALDAVQAGGGVPIGEGASANLERQTRAFAEAYRKLSVRYGHDLYT